MLALVTGTHWMWEIIKMLTLSSSAFRGDHKHDSMIELGFNSITDTPPTGTRRVLNTHLCYNDVPPNILSNSK